MIMNEKKIPKNISEKNLAIQVLNIISVNLQMENRKFNSFSIEKVNSRNNWHVKEFN